MAKHGPAFYDDDAVFAAYARTREAWPDNPNDTIEQPIMRELAAPLAGQRILDLGCGAARFGSLALAAGARSYLGIDGSRKMLTQARATLESIADGTVIQADLETWMASPTAFDLVVSSLALHYVANLDDVLTQVFVALAPGGKFVCSVEHPVFTAADCGGQSGPNPDCLVDNYFTMGPRKASWLGETVIKYHRTIEAYVSALQRAGLVIDALRESVPEQVRFVDGEEYKRRMRVPLFLFLRAHKPSSIWLSPSNLLAR